MRSIHLPVAVALGILSGCLPALACSGKDASSAQQVRVAVASNFAPAMRELQAAFEKQEGCTLSLMVGSTGKLYAQIRNGGPVDLFFAADERRPRMLEEEGRIVAGSRFTYAVGRLVLWSPIEDYVQEDGEPLIPPDCRHLAIANPALAPYGKAAEEVLRARGMWQSLGSRYVRGENIGQAFQFVRSGNVEAGFVAYSQVKSPDGLLEGSSWLVPEDLHAPIEQQAVVLRDSPGTRAFLDFLRTEDAARILHGYGYATP
jgi:molybdate transport system substrate-binding protein